ncbi:MAG TPA: hypothetical protein VGF28_19680 [Thermoanaerobaculia bacterium]|jgi:hypothetical protein
MAIILPHGLTSQEIRVLQEYRRLNGQTLTLDQLKVIKHPGGGGGEAPAVSLVGKGFLTGNGEGFTLTQKAQDFLAIDAKPAIVGTSDAAASAVENPDADGV